MQATVSDWVCHDQKPESAADVEVCEALAAGLFYLVMVMGPAELAPGKFS